MKPVKVGIIGCGNISDIYIKNLTKKFRMAQLVACADLIPERSKAKEEAYGIRSCSVNELLDDPEIEIVVNLTIPKAHFDVCDAALSAGKNVYVEKPLSLNRENGRRLLEKAREKGLLLGCAPDTFLGGGIQTCRKLIDDGWIGTPVASTAFMVCHGHESWHPDPEFYYQHGGGPLFDMGPYYLTALINLMGPVKRVAGSCRITFPQRLITSEKKYGTIIDVEVPTHIAGTMDFESGVIGTLITSFDVWDSKLPRIEIYGSEGSMIVPDPNSFGGPVYVKRKNHTEWSSIPLTHQFDENSRGIGVADMACCIRNGGKNRASGELAYHVLDVMQGFLDSSEAERYYLVGSTCSRPEALSGKEEF